MRRLFAVLALILALSAVNPNDHYWTSNPSEVTEPPFLG